MNQFNDAIKHYINEDMSDTDKILIRRQSKHLGKKDLDSINSLDIKRYVNRIHKHNKSSTIKRDLNIIKAVLNHACDLGLMVKIPKIIMPKVDDARDRHLLPHEKKQYLNELQGDEIGILSFILYTGCRSGEARQLKAHNLFHDHFIIETSHKGRYGRKNKRVVNIPKKLQTILSTVKLNTSGYVFVHRDKSSHRYIGKPFSAKWLRNHNKRVCNVIGIKDYTVHDHRHTYGTELKRLGVGETTIADLMGHSNLDMVRRYTKLSRKDHQVIVDKLS